MRAGGIRGGIFSVFVSSEGDHWDRVVREDGVIEMPPASPVEHGVAAAAAGAVAGRLLALERAGAVCVARRLGDLDARLPGTGRRRPCCISRGPSRSIRDSRRSSCGTRRDCARSVRCGAAPMRSATASRSSSPPAPDTGPGLTEAGLALVRRCAELGILVDVSHLNEAGFWDLARLELGPIVATHSAVHALCPASRNLTDRQLDADRGRRLAWSGSCSPARSCGPTSPMMSTRRSS